VGVPHHVDSYSMSVDIKNIVVVVRMITMRRRAMAEQRQELELVLLSIFL